MCLEWTGTGLGMTLRGGGLVGNIMELLISFEISFDLIGLYGSWFIFHFSE